MKITVESTSEVVTLVTNEGTRRATEVQARVWEGETESGIRVVCLIARIAVKADQDCTQFERELCEMKLPTIEALKAFPLRLIL
jgi:hypothetical protein